MKWLLSLVCFTTVTAFPQTDRPLLEKLKKTQEQLRGTLPDAIPNPGLGLNQRTEKIAPGRTPNLIPQFQYKPRIIDANDQSMVIALPQDNMPCLVPNTKIFKAIPNAGNKGMLEMPGDPGIYLQRPKS